MKRFYVKMPNYKKPFKAYYKDLDTAQEINKDCVIIEIEQDTGHLKYITSIQDNSELFYESTTPDNKTQIYIYDYKNSIGTVRIRLYKDLSDNHFYDFAEYTLFYNKCGGVIPITRTLSEPKEICDKFILNKIMYDIISSRTHGEPKLVKPKFLKDVKDKSVEFIPKKCKCKYWVVANDLIIFHRDYFSPSFKVPSEDFDKPLSYILKKYFDRTKKDKFNYPDCWGSVVLRNEAYIRFSNIIKYIDTTEPCILANIMCDEIVKYHRFTDDLELNWHNMFEDIIKDLKDSK